MPSSYRKYAVDFNGNHKTDLLREDRDAIGSVANYLKGYGWTEGEGVTVRAEVAGTLPADIRTPRTLADWAVQGGTTHAKRARDKPRRLLEFTVGEGKEYWFALNNFEVITRYNNSDYYAMSVFQLAGELKAARAVGGKRGGGRRVSGKKK